MLDVQPLTAQWTCTVDLPLTAQWIGAAALLKEAAVCTSHSAPGHMHCPWMHEPYASQLIGVHDHRHWS